MAPKKDPCWTAGAALCRYAEEWWRLCGAGSRHSDGLQAKTLANGFHAAQARLQQYPPGTRWAKKSNGPMIGALMWAQRLGWSWKNSDTFIDHQGAELSLGEVA